MHSKLKYYLIFFIGIITSMSLSAQEGIGTDAPDKSAALEIKSEKRGLLIPRVALTELNNPSPISETPAESLLVYNTANNEEVSPGFYYWENGSWKRLLVDGDVNGDVEAYDLTSNQGTISIINGEGSTLQDVRIDIAPSAEDGQVLITENGQVVWSDINLEGVDEADLELEDGVLVFLDDTDGENRLLNAMAKIGIADQGITPIKIASGLSGQVLQTDEDENVIWADLDLNMEPVEPWQIQGTTDKATDNDQNIYQQGNVAIGKTEDFISNATLDVAGSIAGGNPEPNQTLGESAIAVGDEVIASGDYAAAFGKNSKAEANYSFVAGKDNKAEKVGSAAFGTNNFARGNNSFVAGKYLKAGFYEAVFGRYNAFRENNVSSPAQWNDTDPLFQIGNGDKSTNEFRQNALTILKNGKMGIGMLGNLNTEKPQEMLDIGSGNVRVRDLHGSGGNISENRIVTVDEDGVLYSIDADDLTGNDNEIEHGPWYSQITNAATTDNTANIYQMGNVAIGKNEGVDENVALDVNGSIRAGNITSANAGTIGANSFAMGKNSTQASGESSFAFGQNAKATGIESLAFGANSQATANRAFAFGVNNTQAQGKSSFAFGNEAKAKEDYSFAFGLSVEAQNKHEVVFGKYNKNITNSIFQIGNGSNSNNTVVPQTAFSISKNSQIGIGINEAPTAQLDIGDMDGDGLVKIRKLPGTNGSTTDKLVVVDSDGILKSIPNESSGGLEIEDEFVNVNSNTEIIVYENGSLKKARSMMPKYFHMPAVAMPIDASSDLVSPPNIQHNNGTFTINLYAIYQQQFQLTNNSTSISSIEGHTLPTLANTELIYNITYYDPDVFDIEDLTDQGVLTYKIINNAEDASARTYMNIVFEIKD